MDFKTTPGTRYVVMAGNRALGTRTGEIYRSDGVNLVLESTGKKKKVIGPIEEALATLLFRECDPVLRYPLQDVRADGKGRVVLQRYVIPATDREKVLKQLWPFAGKPPSLTSQKFDLHEGKLFRVGDFAVYREDEANLLVSPYYEESGGTVIDWMPADYAKQYET